MNSIFIIKVDWEQTVDCPAGEGIVAYCKNEKTAKKAIKLLNSENKEYNEIFSYEIIHSIEDYMGLKEIK